MKIVASFFALIVRYPKYDDVNFIYLNGKEKKEIRAKLIKVK